MANRAETIGDNGRALGARLRIARQAARISAETLAAIIGVTEGAIRQVENGDTKIPNAVILLRIARELHVDPNELAFGVRLDEHDRAADKPAPAPKANPEAFGERLRGLREAKGFSVPDLASAVGVSESAIRQLEVGNVKSPSFALGLRIADRLGVDPYHLALGEGFSTVERLERLERLVHELQQRLDRQPYSMDDLRAKVDGAGAPDATEGDSAVD